jgi:hypothetical protein
MPLVFIPFVLSALSDAIVAFGRIGAFLTAEELPDPYAIDFERKNAVDVDASFAWETAGEIGEPKFAAGAGGGGGRGGKGGGRGGKGGGGRGGAPKKEKKKEKPKKGAKGEELPTTNEKTASGATTPREEEKPFELRNLKFSVPKGAFVAIVGKVGSGKVRWTGCLWTVHVAHPECIQSSILQGLIGEMRRTAGTVCLFSSFSLIHSDYPAWVSGGFRRHDVIRSSDCVDSKRHFATEHHLRSRGE